jgi:hypothetical protein
MKARGKYGLVAASIVAMLLVCVGIRLGVHYVFDVLEVGWTREIVQASQLVGDQICAALQRHREVHGRYPATLDALVPTFMQSVPPPTTRLDKWVYVPTGDGEAFKLLFAANESHYPCAWIDSESKGVWRVDQ